MPDIFLYAGQLNPNDIKLSDPTVMIPTGGGGALVAIFRMLLGVG